MDCCSEYEAHGQNKMQRSIYSTALICIIFPFAGSFTVTGSFIAPVPGIASLKRMFNARFRCCFIYRRRDLVTLAALCLSSPRLYRSPNNDCFLYPFVCWFTYIREKQNRALVVRVERRKNKSGAATTDSGGGAGRTQQQPRHRKFGTSGIRIHIRLTTR